MWTSLSHPMLIQIITVFILNWTWNWLHCKESSFTHKSIIGYNQKTFLWSDLFQKCGPDFKTFASYIIFMKCLEQIGIFKKNLKFIRINEYFREYFRASNSIRSASHWRLQVCSSFSMKVYLCYCVLVFLRPNKKKIGWGRPKYGLDQNSKVFKIVCFENYNLLQNPSL